MIFFIEVLDRAHTGHICDLKEWNVKIIPSKTKEKLEEYGLKSARNEENPINNDNGLVDEFWRAGFELATML